MNDEATPELARVVVAGHTGAGKSTFADAIATILGTTRFDLDDLMRTESWRLRPEAEFRRRVHAAAAGERWVASGDASRVRLALWRRAQCVIWLDYPWGTTVRRFWSRFQRQGEHPERVWGPRGRAIVAFVSRARLLPDTLIDHALRGPQIREALRDERLRHLAYVRLRSPAEADRWLATLRTRAGASPTSRGDAGHRVRAPGA